MNCLRQRRPGTQVTADESLRGDSGRKVSPVFLVAGSRSYEGRPFSNGRKIQDLTSRNRVISSDYRSGPRSGRREKAERPRPALSEGIQIGRGREVHTWQRAPEAVARQPPREWDGRPQAGRSHVPARLAGSRPTSEGSTTGLLERLGKLLPLVGIAEHQKRAAPAGSMVSAVNCVVSASSSRWRRRSDLSVNRCRSSTAAAPPARAALEPRTA